MDLLGPIMMIVPSMEQCRKKRGFVFCLAGDKCGQCDYDGGERTISQIRADKVGAQKDEGHHF